MASPEALAQLRLGRILVAGMAVALLALLCLPTDTFGSNTSLPLWTMLILGLVVVDATALVLFADRMVKPLPSGLDATSARSRGVATLRALILIRAAMAPTPALIGLGLAAIAHTTTTPFLLMVPVSLALLALAYPRTPLVLAVRDRLERTGTTSHLAVTDTVTSD